MTTWRQLTSAWTVLLAATVALVTVTTTTAMANDTGPRFGSLVISEVFADPLLVADRAGEFVEVANLSGATIDVANLALRLPSGRVVQARKTTLLPAGRVVVMRPKLSVVHRQRKRTHAIEAELRGLSLPNRAGRLELLWRGRVVDVAQWWAKWPWPKARAGRSLSRRGPNWDGRQGRSWRHDREPLRVVERASPGRHGWSCRQLQAVGPKAIVGCRQRSRRPSMRRLQR